VVLLAPENGKPVTKVEELSCCFRLLRLLDLLEDGFCKAEGGLTSESKEDSSANAASC